MTKKLKYILVSYFYRLLPFLFFLGCSSLKDRSVLYTEQGLVAAEALWDIEYNRVLQSCQEKFEPRTSEAEQCFGSTYDADLLVNKLVSESVELLRWYWKQRADGFSPDYHMVFGQVRKRIEALPEDVRDYFYRVEGVR